MWPRHLQARLLESLEDTRVVLLHGARQTGKTVLARDQLPASADATYLTLDDATILAAAAEDPPGFVDGLSGLTVLDEVQRVPELLLALKADVDRDPTPGRFLLTGSSNALMLPRLADSLAGRMEVHRLWPLSQGEVAGVTERFVDALFADRLELHAEPESSATLTERMLLGGYPEVRARKTARRRAAWFRAYVTTILQRDVREIARIEGIAQLPRLLAILGARSGGLLNLAELSRDAGLPRSTVERYVRVLQQVFLVDLLPAWSTDPGKRLMKAPKVLLSDSGLLSWLLDLSPERLARDVGGTLRGTLTETFVVTELLRQLGWSEVEASASHYRTYDGAQVDLVLEDRAGRIVGVEIRAGHKVPRRALRGLRSLQQAAGSRFHRGVVLYGGPEVLPLGEALTAVPIPAMWCTTAASVRAGAVVRVEAGRR